MSNRRNNSSILPFLFIAIFFSIASGGPGPIVFGIIAYTIFKMFNSDNDRERQKRREYRDYERGRRPSSTYSDQRRRQYETRRPTTRTQTNRPASPIRPQQNPFKISGIKKYKDYDYEGAIEDFKKALSVDAKDVAVHFNLACAYSIMEQPQLSLIHLDRAVENGFKDLEKIKNHDALAFVRIQEAYDEFVENGFRLKAENNVVTEEEKINESSNLLEQLQKLGELRERGLLTEEEFQLQKEKLLNR